MGNGIMASDINEIAGVSSTNVFDSDSNLFRPATVLFENGKISNITSTNSNIDGVADYGNDFIIPGIVDTHAHINEPGRTDWEGFATATKAAAAGGITTVIDMPLNSIPPTTTVENFQIKELSARDQCSIDYGFWGGVLPDNHSELEGLINCGLMGFKSFLIDSGVEEFPKIEKNQLCSAMRILAKHGVPQLVHAELDAEVDSVLPTLSQDNSGGDSYEDYVKSRPDRWETDAISLVIELVRLTGCAAHIVHLSTATAVKSLCLAKEEGLPITFETCPHYLVFRSEGISETKFKCAPPIRNQANQDQLWTAIEKNQIDMIVSDHSPCTPSLKKGDFHNAWGGIAGIQFSLPSVWTEMQKRNLSLTRIPKLMCEGPAKLAGLQNQKGKIKIGFDADIAVLKSIENIIDSESILHKHKLSPFIGLKLSVKIVATILRGKTIFERGQIKKALTGRHLKRPISP